MAAANLPALLSDSLASLSKSAFQVFTEVENQSRAEVARAIADAREARNERDKATTALHASRIEEESLKQQLILCKASLKQAELTISHQMETIMQIRREANQWKDQSRNWQEHFLRVEQERCTLSSRIDELMTERLRDSHVATPFTPKPQDVNLVGSAPSSRTTKKASTSALLPQKPTRPSSPFTSESPITMQRSTQSIRPKSSKSTKTKPSTETKTTPLVGSNMRTNLLVSKTHQPSFDSPTRTHRNEVQPVQRQTVIRRVEAVVHVKQEGTDDDISGSDANEEADKVAQVKRKHSSMRGKKRICSDDERSSMKGVVSSRERQKDADEESYGDEGVDNDDDEDDEDDELMMGTEGNHHELYGTQCSGKDDHSSTNMPSPNRKRKRTAPGGGRRKPQVKRKV